MKLATLMSKNLLWGVLYLTVFLISCTQKEFTEGSGIGEGTAVFKLYSSDYENESERHSSRVVQEYRYDHLFYYLVEEDGTMVTGVKSFYNSETGEIVAEGLHAGRYKLLVLGINGDYQEDGATIHTLEKESDTWLTFPETLTHSLVAEYFHTATPFEVIVQTTPSGEEEVVSMNREVELKRFIGCLDCQFVYQNPYVRTAVSEEKLILEKVQCYNSLAGGGQLGGCMKSDQIEFDIFDGKSIYLPPTLPASGVTGKIGMRSRRYTGGDVSQQYVVQATSVLPNCVSVIRTEVIHPEDHSGVMFFTDRAYQEARHSLMFQDDEPVEVYTNRGIRTFKVNEPLQVRYDKEKDSLMFRFFLPKPLEKVLLRVRIPSVCNEDLEVAYFDSIPGLAEMYCRMPLTTRRAFYRTESGRKVEIGPVSPEVLSTAEFKIDSDTEYWRKLQTIKHAWTIGFHTFNTDPDLGNVIGNWKSPRPVHCREYLIAFINMAYMFNMPEYWDLMEENNDSLLDNNKQKIELEELKRRHWVNYNFHIALCQGPAGQADTYPNFTRYAVAQFVLDKYYPTDPHTLFHEFGHVMGYMHSSTMSYGTWAEKLCNDFYLQHFKDFPIESRDYNDYFSNPNRY